MQFDEKKLQKYILDNCFSEIDMKFEGKSTGILESPCPSVSPFVRRYKLYGVCF
jgi:hypothetical protein